MQPLPKLQDPDGELYMKDAVHEDIYIYIYIYIYGSAIVSGSAKFLILRSGQTRRHPTDRPYAYLFVLITLSLHLIVKCVSSIVSILRRMCANHLVHPFVIRTCDFLVVNHLLHTHVVILIVKIWAHIVTYY